MAKQTRKKFDIDPELLKTMTIGPFRMSYQHVIEPWTNDPEKLARYSLQAIFDKKKDKAEIERIRERITAIGEEAFGAKFSQLCKSGKLRCVLRNGDLEFEDDPTYQGKVFFNAVGASEGKKPPPIIDNFKRDMRTLDNLEDIFFSGVYVKAAVRFYPYDQQGGKGVACYLQAVQYLKTGEQLGAGGVNVDTAFDEEETGEDVFASGYSTTDDDEEEERPSRRSRRKADKPTRRRRRREEIEDDHDDDDDDDELF